MEQPPVVRMVSWQDAHGKDLYTVCPLRRPQQRSASYSVLCLSTHCSACARLQECRPPQRKPALVPECEAERGGRHRGVVVLP